MPAQTLNLQTLKAQLKTHLKQTQKGLESWDLKLLAHGEANVIYRLNQTSLVRVAVNTPNHRFEGKISRLTQFEQTVLQYIHQTGIGQELQGAFLKPNADFPYSYLITNFIEGNPLNYSREHLEKCAHTLAQIHRLPLKTDYSLDRLTSKMPIIKQPLTLFYNESKAYVQPYLEFPQAEPKIVAMLEAVLAKAQERLKEEKLLEEYPYICLVHSDHTYDNWVIDRQKAHLIDWEWAELSSPAGDLGHFLSPVVIRRCQGYKMPREDREFFLRTYYNALEDEHLATTIERHFYAFGVYPAVRSLCWTAGYWVTAMRWYDRDSPNAKDRLARFQASRNQFPEFWQEIMQWLNSE